jgi:hypothetical protein
MAPAQQESPSWVHPHHLQGVPPNASVVPSSRAQHVRVAAVVEAVVAAVVAAVLQMEMPSRLRHRSAAAAWHTQDLLRPAPHQEMPSAALLQRHQQVRASSVAWLHPHQ